MYPTWPNGGLYYLRCDVGADNDADGNWTFMDPFSRNTAIGYARLNVLDGQKAMWEHPWTKKDISSRPWIENVDLDDEVDALRGFWDEEKRVMVASWRMWDGRVTQIRPVRNLNEGWYVD